MAASTVEEYLQSVPEQAKPYLEQLRELVKQEVPEANEVVSYGILGYKLSGINRAFVYVSGYAKHVSIHPVPASIGGEYTQEMDSHQAGKGTLHFSLDKPLPMELITKVIRALHAQANPKSST